MDRLHLTEHEARKMFREIDVDGSQEISRNEFVSAIGLSEPSLFLEDLRKKARGAVRWVSRGKWLLRIMEESPFGVVFQIRGAGGIVEMTSIHTHPIPSISILTCVHLFFAITYHVLPHECWSLHSLPPTVGNLSPIMAHCSLASW